MKKLIKEYLKTSIEARKSFKKELKRIDSVVNTLAIAQAKQNILFEEMSKESYKTKFKEEHKKFREYEKESKLIIDELTNEIKYLRKTGDKK